MRHWRGDFPLPLSFWGGGVLVRILSASLNEADSLLLSRNENTYVFIGWLVIFYGVMTLAFAWWFVGAWRSATKWKRKDGRWPWGRLAKIAICFLVLREGYVYSTFAWPEFALAISGLEGDPQFGARGVRLTDTPTELEIYGFLSRDIPREFERTLNAHSGITAVRLTSDGGRMGPARDIARIVKSHGLDTLIITECDSACTLVFLAGKHRLITSTARVGFHNSGYGGQSISASGGIAEEEMISAGLPQTFITKVLNTPPQSMWYPTVSELESAKVITGVLANESL